MNGTVATRRRCERRDAVNIRSRVTPSARASIARTSHALALALVVGGVGLTWTAAADAQVRDEFGGLALRGAGSSFAAPLLARWVDDYRSWRTGGVNLPAVAGSGLDGGDSGPRLDYEPVGSQAGIERLKAGAVDFAVSELPLGGEDLKTSRLLQVPIVTGAVAVTYHLAGSRPGSDQPALQLDGPLLADIFSGRITRWSDPAIAARNPTLGLPDAAIKVIHRADGSGTTYTFSNWLARASEDWSRQVGAGLTLKWPVGDGVRGSSAVVDAVLRTPNAISYVNLVEATSRGAAVASIANRDGQPVAPSAASVRHAVAGLAQTGQPGALFSALLLDAPGDGAYPIVATVYGLATDDRSRGAARAQQFLGWALSRGVDRAEALGYVALPPAVAEQAKKVLGD